MIAPRLLRLLPFALPLLFGCADGGPSSTPPVALTAATTAPAVGFESRILPDGTPIGIWYPAHGPSVDIQLGPYRQAVAVGVGPDGTHHPLVVISHGNGGSYSGHYDTAIALAQAGFVVAALTHPGDNWHDQSRATDMQSRPVALSGLVSFMLGTWEHRGVIDAAKVGAFGFSAGGFTVLAAAGGNPDLARVAVHCAAHPALFDCGVLRAHPGVPGPWHRAQDSRIKAIVVAAPALGFTFDRARLAAVTIPVQLWRADEDAILPAPDYADAVRAALPQAPEFHAVPGAGHYDFLAPCAAAFSQLPICTSAAGFDRAAFHAAFNAAVVRFFRQAL